MSEVEETLNRIMAHRGVRGIVVVNAEGVAIRSTLSAELTKRYSSQITDLASRARSLIRDLDPTNDLVFLRVRSKLHEILVAPEQDYSLIVIQEPEAAQSS
eukprot:GHVT01009740.1.p2 GENE.GHVT01009740.1~~GHVT01009740.1.p2  ORF type:complete len:101 (-),score=10.85 GHVT01009740.1:1386-1688(-)